MDNLYGMSNISMGFNFPEVKYQWVEMYVSTGHTCSPSDKMSIKNCAVIFLSNNMNDPIRVPLK